MLHFKYACESTSQSIKRLIFKNIEEQNLKIVKPLYTKMFMQHRSPRSQTESHQCAPA